MSKRGPAAAAGNGSPTRRGVLAAAILVVGMVVTVAAPSGAHPASEPPIAATDRAFCHPLAVTTCVLPFPSDEFTVADADSVTGGPSTSATQVPVSAPNPQLAAFLGHLAFLQPQAIAAQRSWMDDVDAMFRN